MPTVGADNPHGRSACEALRQAQRHLQSILSDPDSGYLDECSPADNALIYIDYALSALLTPVASNEEIQAESAKGLFPILESLRPNLLLALDDDDDPR